MTTAEVITRTLMLASLPLLLTAIVNLIIGEAYSRVMDVDTVRESTARLSRAKRLDRILTLAVIAPLVGVSVAIVLIGAAVAIWG